MKLKYHILKNSKTKQSFTEKLYDVDLTHILRFFRSVAKLKKKTFQKLQFLVGINEKSLVLGMHEMQRILILLTLVIAQIKTLRKWHFANATSYGHWVHRELEIAVRQSHHQEYHTCSSNLSYAIFLQNDRLFTFF